MNADVTEAQTRRRVVGAIGFGQLLAWASSYYLIAILGAPMAAGVGVSVLFVYAAFSASLLVAAAVGPFAGSLMDKRGGRVALLLSNFIFAASLIVLATASGPISLTIGWLLMGVAMPFGLYDAAFTTLVSLYLHDARRSIVSVTLIAGFASSISWPLSSSLNMNFSWRVTCATWAALHLTIGLAINYWLIPPVTKPRAVHTPNPLKDHVANAPSNTTLWVIAGVFTATGFVFSAMATNLPRLLEAFGSPHLAAVAAASLIGIFQVGGRLAERGFLHRLHPLMTARLSTALHPLGAVLMTLFGPGFAVAFTALHGAGVGLTTIIKGTLPLALFGPTGFGRRAGILEAPSRVAQAVAPLAFGIALDKLGAQAIWISAGIATLGFTGVMFLRAEGNRD